MTNAAVVHAINAVLESWAELDDAHKGKEYNKAVNNLKKWAEDLKTSK